MSCCYESKSFPAPFPFPYFGYYGLPFNPGYCHVCAMPHYHCTCHAKHSMMVPREIYLDTTGSKEDFVGGSSDVRLTLEYMPTASTAKVKVTITESDGTSTWEMTTIPDGYHVKDDFTSVEPGTKIKVEVTDCIARLRWCETISC